MVPVNGDASATVKAGVRSQGEGQAGKLVDRSRGCAFVLPLWMPWRPAA